VSFLRFWYDFVIGDDWKIAAGVVLALAAVLVVLRTGLLGDGGLAVFGGVMVMAAFAIGLAVDVRGSERGDDEER
jgi:hypothetical protein